MTVSFKLARICPLAAVLFLAFPGFAAAATPPNSVAQASEAPAPDFGAPPTGEIPILYNDRHVYAKPDTLRKGRVLAALAKDGTIFVPLRSMFEQMGAAVSYDPDSKIATVSKPGAQIVVTVGKPEVVINGETRPLDVPPIVYNGVVMVPIRVISETMGAYVQWVPDRRLVVVRYIPAVPPTAAPTNEPPPPAPTPTPLLVPNPLTLGGYFRSYYFTRQNASNNPGTQFNFSPGAKYNSNGVNQATWNNGIALHADYNFPSTPWHVGGTYFYANAPSGPCVVPANHLKGAECVTQTPPNTNADDTVPGFMMSTFDEAYVKYSGYGFNGTAGNQLFTSPFANPADARLKPQAFQGADLGWTNPTGTGLTLEGAYFWAFENRTSSQFTNNTLLTSYPAGNPGLPANIVVPGGNGITTDGFAYGKAGYTSGSASADAYYYNVFDLVNMWWFDGKYAFGHSAWAPYLALQGGFDKNSGQSYIGKVNSQIFGAQIGANITKNVLFQVGYNQIPWHTDSVFLPKNVTCNNSNYQIASSGATLAYFLPSNAAQCFTHPDGSTSIYYGGWASPYSDNTDSDPLFTTSTSQGMVDRRAPGSAVKVGLTFTTNNKRFVFIASDAWYNYGNALAPENTNIWVLDGRYLFSHVPPKGPYHGLMLRYRYIQRQLSDTFCGAAATGCPAGSTLGSTYLGGIPYFKYNRAQLEYDF